MLTYLYEGDDLLGEKAKSHSYFFKDFKLYIKTRTQLHVLYF